MNTTVATINLPASLLRPSTIDNLLEDFEEQLHDLEADEANGPSAALLIEQVKAVIKELQDLRAGL